MFRKIAQGLTVFVLVLIFAGCSSSKPDSGLINGKVQIVVIDRLQNPIKDAQVIFVSNNKYIGKALTDQQGKTGEISVNSKPDSLVKEIMDKNFRRGAVNIIVSKPDYRDDVVFEAWVYENAVSTQIVKLDKTIEGERNEPEYTVQDPYRLEVIRYVDYYKNITK